jgi:hypothetical protein
MQSLLDPDNRKHRRVLAAVEAATARALRQVGSVRLVMPTTVRVEAGWDRCIPAEAAINRLHVDDAPLDRPCCQPRGLLSATLWAFQVADVHLAAVMTSAAGPVAVVTGDVADIRGIVGHL